MNRNKWLRKDGRRETLIVLLSSNLYKSEHQVKLISMMSKDKPKELKYKRHNQREVL